MMSHASAGSSVSRSRSTSAGVDRRLREQRRADPVDHARPVLGAHQDHREVLHLLRLDQGERLEQLVERPVAARKDHERVGVLHEHDLAREEVAELDAEIDVRVEPLLHRQLDVAADRQATAFLGATVGGRHDPRAAAGDDRVALLAPASSRARGPSCSSGGSPWSARSRRRSRPARRPRGHRTLRRTPTGSGGSARDRSPGTPGGSRAAAGAPRPRSGRLAGRPARGRRGGP